MTSRGLRLFAYGRVSDVRGREGESFISPDEQMRKCRDYASAYDHTIIEEGLDLDVSGGVMSRPVLDRFLEAIKAGEADGLIVAKLDRFSRSSRGALNALHEIEAAKGVLISVQEQIDSTTAAGKFVRSIFLATAEWERDRIGESWQSAKASAVARGVHITSRVPAGYKRNGSGRLEPDGRNAETIREAYAMVARGESYSAVANFLNERKLPVWHPVKGNGLVQEAVNWQPNRIKRLLGNRVYLGEARSGNDHVKPDAHEPLVSAEMWLRAQRQKDRRDPTPALKGAPALLAGLVRCAGCSHAMRPQGGTRKVVGVYRCTKTSAGGTCAESVAVSRDRIDEYVLAEFLAHHEVEAERVTSAPDDETDALLAAAVEAESAYRSVLEDGELAKQLGPVDHSRLVATYKGNWEAAQAAVPVTRAAPTTSIDLAQHVAMLRESEDVDGLRELLGSAIQAVFVRPAASRSKTLPIADRLRIVWQGEEALDLPKRGEAFGVKPYRW